jgi:hypothetical protein
MGAAVANDHSIIPDPPDKRWDGSISIGLPAAGWQH